MSWPGTDCERRLGHGPWNSPVALARISFQPGPLQPARLPHHPDRSPNFQPVFGRNDEMEKSTSQQTLGSVLVNAVVLPYRTAHAPPNDGRPATT